MIRSHSDVFLGNSIDNLPLYILFEHLHLDRGVFDVAQQLHLHHSSSLIFIKLVFKAFLCSFTHILCNFIIIIIESLLILLLKLLDSCINQFLVTIQYLMHSQFWISLRISIKQIFSRHNNDEHIVASDSDNSILDFHCGFWFIFSDSHFILIVIIILADFLFNSQLELIHYWLSLLFNVLVHFVQSSL